MRKVFITAWRHELSLAHNTMRLQAMQSALKGLFLSPELVLGSYEDKLEQSFMVEASTIEPLLKLAQEYQQDSILVVEPDGATTLQFCAEDAAQVQLGKFRTVEAFDVPMMDCWSFWRGNYWAAQ